MASTKPVALVTGGAKRIGRSIAEDLAAHGFAVAIHYNHSVDEAADLAAAITQNGGIAKPVHADLTDTRAIRGLISQVRGSLGEVELLVNSASLFNADHVGTLAEAEWDQHFNIHVKAPVFLAEAMARDLPAGKSGLIVNIIDQRVWKLTPGYFSYTLSKSALWTATRTLAQALAPRVRVNAIGPGPTLRNKRQSEEDFRRQAESVLLQHGPDLAEFGRTVRYFWENGSVTGQMVALDGGQHLAWETPDIAGINE
ncbi:MAG: SDR family oxidoreductase [Phyllobacterium sp.]